MCIENCEGVLFQGNLLSDACAGDEARGGAISVLNSHETLIAGCQIFEPRHCGIFVENSRNTTITDCQILDRTASGAMRAAVEVAGTSPGVFIRDTLYHEGHKGGILAPVDADVRNNTRVE